MSPEEIAELKQGIRDDIKTNITVYTWDGCCGPESEMDGIPEAVEDIMARIDNLIPRLTHS
jgi:hypothetical protein